MKTTIPDKPPRLMLSADEIPNMDHLITEDDAPVDNIYSYIQQMILGNLNLIWDGNKIPFVSAVNVGVFYSIDEPAVVPDFFLSMNREWPKDVWEKRNRSYMNWIYGKPPDLAVEVVSNRKGEEDQNKMDLYSQMGVPYYVIWDPRKILKKDPLRCFCLVGKHYEPIKEAWFKDLKIGLEIWEGTYLGHQAKYIRWRNQKGLLPMPDEKVTLEKRKGKKAKVRAKQQAKIAQDEKTRAEQQSKIAQDEKKRADKLTAQLRKLGIEPEV